MITDIATISKPGGREVNQDSVAFSSRGGRLCLVACDGLGAYDGSEDASRIGANRLAANFELCDDPLEAKSLGGLFKSVHDAIIASKRDGETDLSSCTTAACLFADEYNTVVGHIGDTRVYLIEKGAPVHRTIDHSVAQMAVERGEIDEDELRFHKDQNKLTRVLGGKYFVLPDFYETGKPLGKGDAVLICTDGWWEYVDVEEVCEDIATSKTAAEALKKSEKRLMFRADEGHDNYSAVLAIIK